MYFRQLLNDHTACASYLLGCKSRSQFAVVDPHVDLVDDYIALAEGQGIPIVAVFETHVQADHVSGLPRAGRANRRHGLPARGRRASSSSITRSATARWSSSATPWSQAIATPGHAAAHHAYLVTDRTAVRRALDGPHRRRAPGRRRRPTRPPCRRRAERRGDGRRPLSLADRAAAGAPGPHRRSTRLTTRARSAGAASRPIRSRRSASSAGTTAALAVRLRAGLRRGADQGHPPGARAPGRDRRREPQRAGPRREVS